VPLGLIGVGLAGVGLQAYEASQATSVQNTQLGMQQAIFGEQQGYEQQLAQLIANPSSVTSLPGYQFQLQQGSDTVAREMAASGFLGSGNEAAALTQYGQGYAQNFYLAQANLLAQLAGMGPSSAQGAGANAVGAQANTASQMNNMLTQMGAMAGMGAMFAGGGMFA